MIRKSRRCLPVILVLAFAIDICAQNTYSPTPFYSYYYDYKLANPAFTGTKARHVINTTYAGIPSHRSSKLFYGSYERNIASVKSGVGGLVMYEEFGPVTMTHCGLFFSRRLPFGEKSGLHVGTQVFYQSHELDGKYYRYVQDGDPLIGEGTETTRLVNVDLGLLYYSRFVTIGASVKGIREKMETERTSLNVIATREFNITKGLKANPSALFFTDFTDNRFYLNSTFEIKKWILLGLGYRFVEHGPDDISFNVGLNIKDWVQVITHVYSSEMRSDNANALVETMIRVTIPERKSDEPK
jgi:type IX secretion system PorP/SprF family membrane protein